VFAKELSRLYTYAQALATRTRATRRTQGMRQEMIQIASAFGAQSAFIEPELAQGR
jgi:oligoendopeptidase F